jgi:hypothetical protein
MTTPPGDQPPPGDPSATPHQAQQPYQGQYQGQYQQPYQQPYPPYGFPAAPQEHPKATTAMVLGILGLVMCGVAAPFAWAIGKRAVAEIDASGGRLGGRSQAQTGYILGIVGTVLLGLGLLFLVFYFIVVVVAIGGMAASNA